MRILTGAAGTGKSWLWRQAVAHTRQIRSDLRWIWIPKWPASQSPDLLPALAGALEDSGRATGMSPEHSYVLAEQRLQEMHEDGFGVRIVIEEAHHLKEEEYESLRIMTERLNPIGMDLAILLVGRTSLNRRFRRYSSDFPSARLHLPHISLPETLELLGWFSGSDRSWSRSEADWIHREALGNPRRIVRWAESLPLGNPVGDKPSIKPGFGYEGGGERPAAPEAGLLHAEPLIPTRPPLNESEGVIEVGYEDDFAAPPRISSTWIGTLQPESDSEETTADETERDTPERKVRYRIETAEGFAPYGISTGRTEGSPGKSQN